MRKRGEVVVGGWVDGGLSMFIVVQARQGVALIVLLHS